MSSTIVPCEVVEPVYGSSKIDMRIDSFKVIYQTIYLLSRTRREEIDCPNSHMLSSLFSLLVDKPAFAPGVKTDSFNEQDERIKVQQDEIAAQSTVESALRLRDRKSVIGKKG